ncbi:MAG: NADH-quinone oxidoreductase subunit L [Caldisericaceae bacterium]|nr:NADH-quinone oxidoreductase subunit L [Caldisericaceae bacterium]
MYDLLWLVPTFPFLGFLILAIFGKKIGKKLSAVVGVGSIGLSALITILIGIQFLTNPPEGHAFVQTLWTWIAADDFKVNIAFHLDALSMVFAFVVTFVGFWIHLYSTEYMADDEGFSRFFAYMNLFVGAMLMLVMGDNLLLLYLGWEGVGLCSYLLIGFWYRDPANGYAARKAFIVTRVGDAAMAVGLFMLFYSFKSLNIQEILSVAPHVWSPGNKLAVASTLLLLGGAVGKSAQLPLQVWLPDAMAGPTPTSALIHAATMVTAGVYLIARMNGIYLLAPLSMTAVAIVGAATLLVAGFAGMAQTDIKRVLAYSTVSQIGYMFLALGVGAWSAGVFHFMIHAFFKALLFLAAGAIILAQHHEQNMFKMGGLAKALPVTFWTFLIGSASLAALPLITAGFYSKDAIIWYAWSGPNGSIYLWMAAVFGAMVTAFYTFRMVFVTFFGEQKMEISHYPTWRVHIPLIALAFFALFGGFIELPGTLGHLTLFSDFMKSALPVVEGGHHEVSLEIFSQVLTAVLALVSIFVAYYLYLKNMQIVTNFTSTKFGHGLQQFLLSGLGFDWLYERLFIRPYVWLSRTNKRDFIDFFYVFLPWLARQFHYLFKYTQTGKVRRYVVGIVFGVLVSITIVVIL